VVLPRNLQNGAHTMTTDLARTIAALPEPQYRLFWLTRTLDRLCQLHGEEEGIRRFQDQLDHEAQEHRP
jgi:hypothetical protein